jgi:signal transduction histidine kinase
MQKLVENLLFLARGDIGQWDVAKHSFSVKDLMEELLGEQSAMDPAHRYVLSAVDDIALHGDRNMIKQMLLALIDNSRKYTPDGGEIKIISEQAGGKVRLTVKDTGIGMSEEQLSHIFERFYRADKSRSRRDGSAGLGLSIAAAIAQLHAAEILAQSSPDQGTSIAILFPNLKRPYVSR